ncbi:hypothetical protein [Pseudonocardia sp. ICBG601]|uniref:hypothetical protein n=1 Tax=Pseudonocardia sp. ICBG601 TaxID=2846759 RepID=UPI001CF655E1|nr:hypothetical protein [Pseudonocardia sp. ICBG601]
MVTREAGDGDPERGGQCPSAPAARTAGRQVRGQLHRVHPVGAVPVAVRVERRRPRQCHPRSGQDRAPPAGLGDPLRAGGLGASIDAQAR